MKKYQTFYQHKKDNKQIAVYKVIIKEIVLNELADTRLCLQKNILSI